MSMLYFLEMVIFIITLITFLLSTSKNLNLEQKIIFLGIASCFQLFAIPIEYLLGQNYLISTGLFGIISFDLVSILVKDTKNDTTNKEEEYSWEQY